MSDCWFALYPGDYLRDTADLPLVHHGAYFRLLASYYSTGAPLPTDPTALYRIAGSQSDEERAAVDAVVKRFFVLHEGAYHNRRADHELDVRRKHHQQLSASGQRGANRRWAGNHSDANGHPIGHANSHPISESIASPQPQPQPKPELKPTPCADAQVVPVEIWLAFVAHRKKLRSPLTEHASYLVRRKLERLKAQGHDPVAALEQSIQNGWKGIFPVGKQQANGERQSFLGPGRPAYLDEPPMSDEERAAAILECSPKLREQLKLKSPKL